MQRHSGMVEKQAQAEFSFDIPTIKTFDSADEALGKPVSRAAAASGSAETVSGSAEGLVFDWDEDSVTVNINPT